MESIQHEGLSPWGKIYTKRELSTPSVGDLSSPFEGEGGLQKADPPITAFLSENKRGGKRRGSTPKRSSFKRKLPPHGRLMEANGKDPPRRYRRKAKKEKKKATGEKSYARVDGVSGVGLIEKRMEVGGGDGGVVPHGRLKRRSKRGCCAGTHGRDAEWGGRASEEGEGRRNGVAWRGGLKGESGCGWVLRDIFWVKQGGALLLQCIVMECGKET